MTTDIPQLLASTLTLMKKLEQLLTHRVSFIEDQRENFSVREVMPLSGPVLVEFINGVLNNNTEKD